MNSLEIDIETYSSVELKKCGVYKYAESPDFALLLFGYSIDGGEVQVVDTANGETIPQEILNALQDDSVIKSAHNASFERICLSRYLGVHLKPNSWRCTMVWSAYLGLPLSLEQVGMALGLEKQKLTEGKELIRLFCVPDKNGNRPACKGEKWQRFKAYNKRDVETEMEIQQKLSRFPVPDFVWEEYILDQQINDRGIGVDMEFVEAALELDAQAKATLSAEMCRLTGVENPNSVYQLLEWLESQGYSSDSLDKKNVIELMKTAKEPVRTVLALRQQLAKSSVKKYQAMQKVACADGKARGCFQFYGANRSGRFSGRLIQLQNLPQNHLQFLTQAREMVKYCTYDEVEMLYDDVPDTLSQLIRTALVPQKGCKFIVADFSAIEARVLAWLADEEWRMMAFANGEDIYCASASQMFGVPVQKHGTNGHLRQKGKVAELACGYGGSIGAMKAMGADEMGLTDSEIQQIVTDWRDASPHIVQLWWEVDRAVKKCVREKTSASVKNLFFSYESGFLFVTLPSGRRLAYVKPRIGENKFGGESVTYMGLTSSKKWERLESYGPKFVENITQAIARDILCFAMKNLQEFAIVAHIHDEVVIEAERETTVEEICNIMGQTPPWAKGLLLRADGYESEYYKKD